MGERTTQKGSQDVKDAATVASKPGGICHLLQAVPPVVSIVDGEFSTETWLKKHCEEFPTGKEHLSWSSHAPHIRPNMSPAAVTLAIVIFALCFSTAAWHWEV